MGSGNQALGPGLHAGNSRKDLKPQFAKLRKASLKTFLDPETLNLTLNHLNPKP